MEKKTKQRILGIVVLIGLGILVFPLLQTSKELSNQVTVTKAPPFPETAEAEATPAEEMAAPVREAKPVADPQPVSVDSSIKAETDDVSGQREQLNQTKQSSAANDTPVSTAEPIVATANADEPTLVSDENTVTTVAPTEIAQAKTKSQIAPSTQAEQSQQPNSLLAHDEEAKKAKAITPALSVSNISRVKKQSLAAFSQSAWVIQLGSFNKKANAVRLVNHLRANGYKAFIQQMTAANGTTITRVLVGPENRRSNARALASRLEGDTHLKGIVMSYKPLSL